MNRNVKVVSAVLLCVALAACGGSSPSGPTTTATPVPTPTPVSYSGTYSGPMTGTGNGVAAVPCSGRTVVTHTGTAISFGDLTVTGCFTSAVTFGGASSTLNGNSFSATSSYNSTGCGVIASAWTGFFSGDGRLMNLRVVLTPGPSAPSDCGGVLQFLGEITKQ